MKRLLGMGRYLLLVAIFGSLAAAAAVLGYAATRIGQLVVEAIQSAPSAKGFKALTLGCIEAVDGFLVATVFLIVAVGLYELFFDDTLSVPRWLVIRSLDDLKNKLASMLVVVLAVLFLGQVVNWDGTQDLLGFGIAIALVVAALTYFLSQKTRGGSEER